MRGKIDDPMESDHVDVLGLLKKEGQRNDWPLMLW